MRGTGSNALSEDLFVPEGFVIAPDARPLLDRPYYRAPLLVHALPSDAAVIRGIVESVLDSMIPALNTQKSAATRMRSPGLTAPGIANPNCN